MASKTAPCGCGWRSNSIHRKYRSLFPAVFVYCNCSVHQETWTERYEFDYSISICETTYEKAEYEPSGVTSESVAVLKPSE